MPAKGLGSRPVRRPGRHDRITKPGALGWLVDESAILPGEQGRGEARVSESARATASMRQDWWA